MCSNSPGVAPGEISIVLDPTAVPVNEGPLVPNSGTPDGSLAFQDPLLSPVSGGFNPTNDFYFRTRS